MEQRSTHVWDWLFIAAAVLLIGVPVAFAGLAVTSDLCGRAFEGEAFTDRYENIVESVAVRCFATGPAGNELEELRINWLGVGGAVAFVIGVFMFAAGIARVLPRGLALKAAGICLSLCVVFAALFFA